MPNLAKLRRDHIEILKIVERLRFLIGQSTAPPHLHLFALRHELSATLIGHLKSHDWVVYPRLLRCGDAHVASTARAFSDEMGGLGEAYRTHCQKWNAGEIAADWAGYCNDSRHLLDALTHRVTRENRELYPMLEALDQAA